MTTEGGTAPHLESLESALARLRDALAQPKSQWTRDAAIQRFEFTFELTWKAIQRTASREGLDCPSPRQAIRAAATLAWIPDDAVWLDMLDDRNRSSHTYSEATAETIYSHLPTYAAAIAALLGQIRTALADASR